MTSKVDDDLPVHTPVVLGKDNPLFLRPGILRTRPDNRYPLSQPTNRNHNHI
jgi:hypothetical protein